MQRSSYVRLTESGDYMTREKVFELAKPTTDIATFIWDFLQRCKLSFIIYVLLMFNQLFHLVNAAFSIVSLATPQSPMYNISLMLAYVLLPVISAFFILFLRLLYLCKIYFINFKNHIQKINHNCHITQNRNLQTPLTNSQNTNSNNDSFNDNDNDNDNDNNNRTHGNDNNNVKSNELNINNNTMSNIKEKQKRYLNCGVGMSIMGIFYYIFILFSYVLVFEMTCFAGWWGLGRSLYMPMPISKFYYTNLYLWYPTMYFISDYKINKDLKKLYYNMSITHSQFKIIKKEEKLIRCIILHYVWLKYNDIKMEGTQWLHRFQLYGNRQY